jgi:Fe-S cluster assembly iron-binding protein IscA
VRLRIAGGALRPRFVPGAEADDEVVEQDGIRVFIARAILDQHGGDVVIDVTPEHETLMVRPVGSHE